MSRYTEGRFIEEVGYLIVSPVTDFDPAKVATTELPNATPSSQDAYKLPIARNTKGVRCLRGY